MTITYCDNDYLWATATANECGAFVINTTVQSNFDEWFYDVITVRAWVGGVDGDLLATWPLYISGFYSER